MKKAMSEDQNKEFHQKLMSDKKEAQRIISEFQAKMKELCEKSITEYGRLWIHAYAPVESELRSKDDTFVDGKTNIEMYRYLFSEIQIVPLTFVGKFKR